MIQHALQRKSHSCIPFLAIARPQSQYFQIHVSVRDLYIPRIGPHIIIIIIPQFIRKKHIHIILQSHTFI